MFRFRISVIATLALSACGGAVEESPPRTESSHSDASEAISEPTSARTLRGQISGLDDSPLEGVMVRLQNTETLLAETVYTNFEGAYVLPTDLSGPLELRTRVPYHSDERVEVVFDDQSTLELNIALRPMASDEEISDSLPSVFHFNQIEFDQDPESVLSRSAFQRDCAGCHQFGNEFTRRDREESLWSPTIARMHAYLGNLDQKIIARRAAMLDPKGPYGDTVMIRPDFAVDPELYSAKIYEYPLEYVAFPHDAEISPVDGKSYAVDRHGHMMVVTDLGSGENTFIDQPSPERTAEDGANGYTSRTGDPGPHSLALGDGNLWYVTNATSDEIGVFDANTQSWRESYIIPEPGRYPHTIRVDKKNIVWYTGWQR